MRIIFIVTILIYANTLISVKSAPASSRTHFLGPVGEYIADKDNTETHLMLRPILTYTQQQHNTMLNVLGPMVVYKANQYDLYLRVLSLYISQNKALKTFSCAALPFFYYAGNNNKSNILLFPFYGDLTGVFTYSRIHFIMLPFYFYSERFGKKEYSCFWPLVAWSSSNNTHSLRLFPFYLHKINATKISSYSVLWPFINIAFSNDDRNPGCGWHIWPFLGHLSSKFQQRWTTFWPLFEWKKTQSPKQHIEVFDIFWPFFQLKKDLKNNQLTKLYVGPFWGRHNAVDQQMTYYFWPFFIKHSSLKGSTKTESLKLLPFYWQTISSTKSTPTDIKRHCWPLFSYYRNSSGMETRILDLLPLRKLPYLNGLLTPFWSIASICDTKEQFKLNILWGLFDWTKHINGSGKMDISYLYQVKFGMNKQKKHQTGDTVCTIRRFLFGMVKQEIDKNDNINWTLFWSLRF